MIQQFFSVVIFHVFLVFKKSIKQGTLFFEILPKNTKLLDFFEILPKLLPKFYFTKTFPKMTKFYQK
jgi:ABC-type maltose transport system permease subunit